MAGAKGKKPAKRRGKNQEDSVEQLFKQVTAKLELLNSDQPSPESDTFDFVGVVKLLDKVLAIQPDNRDAMNYKGMMFIGMHEHKKAIECFNAILKVNPADKEVLNNKGISLYGLGKDKEALKYVDKAIELDPRYPDAIMNKAVILYGMGQTKEAEKLLMKARALQAIRG